MGGIEHKGTYSDYIILLLWMCACLLALRYYPLVYTVCEDYSTMYFRSVLIFHQIRGFSFGLTSLPV